MIMHAAVSFYIRKKFSAEVIPQEGIFQCIHIATKCDTRLWVYWQYCLNIAQGDFSGDASPAEVEIQSREIHPPPSLELILISTFLIGARKEVIT